VRHLVRSLVSLAAAIATVSSASTAQTALPRGSLLDPEGVEGIATNNDFGTGPIDGPALPQPRLTHAQLTSGAFSLKQIRRRGLEIFNTPFNFADGFGDGPVNPLDPTMFGGRPTTNGTWLRINGLDAQTCQECHAFRSMATVPPALGIAGVAGIANTAFPFTTSIDAADANGDLHAEVNGRLINPPFLFGSGGIELAGKEMTADLQALKLQAMANPGVPVALVTKGVSFGTMVFDTVTGFDMSGVEGIDHDLVVRPFGRKGEFSSIRQFDIGALQFHMGMQADELVGAGVDADGDGVVSEIIDGELTALHVFGTNLEKPIEVGSNRPDVNAGRALFDSLGCAGCHVPALETTTEWLDYAFPEIETDPAQNIYLSTDLTAVAKFKPNGQGGVTVPAYSDLKRHDMGPDLAETTGHPDVDPHFITPRLWGITDTGPYLHDGRALTLRHAIEMHGGEGQAARDGFVGLGAAQQAHLLQFLNSLRTPENIARDISFIVRR
jgi:hypothetical protein